MSNTNATNSSKTFHDAILIPYFFKHLSDMNHVIELFFRTYIYPVFFGIGSSWNILIIAYFVKINSKNLRKMSSYHFLIINLAIVDLYAGLGVTIIFL